MTPPFEKNQGRIIVFNSLRMEYLGRLCKSNIGLSTFSIGILNIILILNSIYNLLRFYRKNKIHFFKKKYKIPQTGRLVNIYLAAKTNNYV